MKLRKAIREVWQEMIGQKQLDPKPELRVIPQERSAQMRLPIDDPDALRKFVDSRPDVAAEFFLKKIKCAISKKQDEAYLFHLGESGKYVVIRQKDYYGLLGELKTHYIQQEQYETAKVCQDLMTKLNVDKLIDETKGG